MRNGPSIRILGYSEAAALLNSAAGAEVTAIIAIHGYCEFSLEAPGLQHYLSLEFDDCEVSNVNDQLAMARFRIRQRAAADIGLRSQPPTARHAQQIVEFARTIADIDGTLMCHCLAGVGRSSAAALICLATWTDPGKEKECMDQVLAVRPCAIPNASLVAFGDEVLGREGRLVSALRESLKH